MECLQTATNAELVEELMGRPNFAGILIFSPRESRVTAPKLDEFRLQTTLDDESTDVVLSLAHEKVIMLGDIQRGYYDQ